MYLCGVIKPYNRMRKFLLGVAVVALIFAVVCGCALGYLIKENARLRGNQHALIEGVEFYRTESGKSAASVEVLQLELAEFRSLREQDAEEIASLGIRLRRAESYAKSVSMTILTDTVVVRDTVVLRDTVTMPARLSCWSRRRTSFKEPPACAVPRRRRNSPVWAAGSGSTSISPWGAIGCREDGFSST